MEDGEAGGALQVVVALDADLGCGPARGPGRAVLGEQRLELDAFERGSGLLGRGDALRIGHVGRDPLEPAGRGRPVACGHDDAADVRGRRGDLVACGGIDARRHDRRRAGPRERREQDGPRRPGLVELQAGAQIEHPAQVSSGIRSGEHVPRRALQEPLFRAFAVVDPRREHERVDASAERHAARSDPPVGEREDGARHRLVLRTADLDGPARLRIDAGKLSGAPPLELVGKRVSRRLEAAEIEHVVGTQTEGLDVRAGLEHVEAERRELLDERAQVGSRLRIDDGRLEAAGARLEQLGGGGLWTGRQRENPRARVGRGARP